MWAGHKENFSPELESASTAEDAKFFDKFLGNLKLADARNALEVPLVDFFSLGARMAHASPVHSFRTSPCMASPNSRTSVRLPMPALLQMQGFSVRSD